MKLWCLLPQGLCGAALEDAHQAWVSLILSCLADYQLQTELLRAADAKLPLQQPLSDDRSAHDQLLAGLIARHLRPGKHSMHSLDRVSQVQWMPSVVAVLRCRCLPAMASTTAETAVRVGLASAEQA